ncbi:hypothetical protein ACH4TX_37835 [Streptomyces sp. NPDC021098]|uniref:hypothetical protein n=1 Tax=unclassified Streptomyces TaxID=2593676 RepID=UPI003788AB86
MGRRLPEPGEGEGRLFRQLARPRQRRVEVARPTALSVDAAVTALSGRRVAVPLGDLPRA